MNFIPRPNLTNAPDRAKGSVLRLSAKNKLSRGLWAVIYVCFFRPSPVFAHSWRRALLRMFGASIHPTAVVYPTTAIWAPWNLEMKAGSCLGRGVDCYSVAKVTLEEDALVSQYSYLCTASHDYRSADFALVAAPITIESRAWVCASVFVGPGVKIGQGAVVGAMSAVFSDIRAWTVVGGNPASFIKDRALVDDGAGT